MPKVRGGGKSSKGGKESKSSESTGGSSTSAPKKLEEFMYAVVAKSDGGGPEILKVQLMPHAWEEGLREKPVINCRPSIKIPSNPVVASPSCFSRAAAC